MPTRMGVRSLHTCKCRCGQGVTADDTLRIPLMPSAGGRYASIGRATQYVGAGGRDGRIQVHPGRT